MQHGANVKTATPAILTGTCMYRDQAALDNFTSTPSFQAFQGALKGSKPVHPPAAEWLDIVDASYEIF